MKKKLLLLLTVLFLILSSYALWAESIEPKIEQLLASTKTWDGETLPAYPTTGQPELSVIRITIPPKSQLPIHKHPVYNVVYVEKGTLTIVLPDRKENNTINLNAGEALAEVMNKWHYGRNDGDEPTIIILFYAGIEGTPVTIYQEAEESSKSKL